jgi:hypothetical protein
MQASIRVMPGCYITGQAAGVAAAMAARAGTDIRGIDIRDLQMRLKCMGAYLPNLGLKQANVGARGRRSLV